METVPFLDVIRAESRAQEARTLVFRMGRQKFRKAPTRKQQKTLEAKDRLAVQQEIAGMRKDQMEWQREIAEEKLGMAKTTKERKDWLTGVRSDLQKNLITAQKNQHMWGVIGSGAYDDAQERLQKLDEISGDVMDGSMSNKDAAQAIFGAHGGESHGGGNFKRNPDGSYSEQ